MFHANDIDIELLGRLSNDDLKEIGVKSLGHRKKLLEAIAGLARAPPVALDPATKLKAHDAAERRQITVMFSDLVGSTSLSARLELEDLREVIAAYQKCVSKTVRRFDGFVAKYMGDGVLIYFGYPQASEDDAERAVRAGLELIVAVAALKSTVSLQARIGIATGLVVVGDLVGSGEAQERGIVGETPNLAARLQGVAEPNTVVIAEGTRRLLGNLFELQDLGPRDFKGIAGPVRAWAALRASSVESRFEALYPRELTMLVGRDKELQLLTERWAKAKTGEGQVVLVSGEAGIGKSRLTAALLAHLASEPHTRLRYLCSPQHTLIVTFRPEFESTWTGMPHVTTLTINRLTQSDIDAMIGHVVGNASLPANIRRDIVDRTDGVPLFVEEMTMGARGRERKRGRACSFRGAPFEARGPCDTACIFDGATRPARPSQGGGADWRDDWAGVLAQSSRRSGRQTRGGANLRSRSPGCRQFVVPAWRPTAGDLPIQARARAGCGLWHAAARTGARAARPYCRNFGEPVC
jgi:class 3 adenylate cyclase